MTQPLLVGLDVGTTASKAVVFTLSGQALAEGRAPTPWQATASGAELDPRPLLDAVLRAGGDARAAAPPRADRPARRAGRPGERLA